MVRNYDGLKYYKGLFNEIFPKISNKKYCLVNIDVDLVESMLECLRYFYSRVSKGGIILSHDYHFEGCKREFNNFFKDINFSLGGGGPCS